MPGKEGLMSAEVQGVSSTLSSAPMVSYFRQIGVFALKVEEWLAYVEWLEMFFVVNNVPKDNQGLL